MEITIITHGLPNSHSEQAQNDSFIWLKYFEKKKIRFNLLSVWDYDYNTSLRGKNYQTKYLKNNFKYLKNIKVLDYKKTSFEKISRFLLRIVSNKPYYFYGNRNIHKKILRILDNLNSKVILNFYDLPASIFSKKNNKFKVFNFIGVDRKSSEILRIKNLMDYKRKFILIKIINSIIYALK